MKQDERRPPAGPLIRDTKSADLDAGSFFDSHGRPDQPLHGGGEGLHVVVLPEDVVRIPLGLDGRQPVVVLAEPGLDPVLALVAGEVEVDAAGGV